MKNIPDSSSIEHLHGAARHEQAMLLGAIRQVMGTTDHVTINTLNGMHAAFAREHQLSSEAIATIASQVGVGRLATNMQTAPVSQEVAVPEQQRPIGGFEQADLAARAGVQLNVGRLVTDAQSTPVVQTAPEQNDPVALARKAVERELANGANGEVEQLLYA